MIAVCVIVNRCAFQEIFAKNDEHSIFTDSITGMEFMRVRGGCFEMGNNFEREGKDEKPIHRVYLDDYYIGRYEGFRLAMDIPLGDQSCLDSIDGFPLGDALLVPIGRSFLGESSVEIFINGRLLPYETSYDGYGGFWAKIPGQKPDDVSLIKIQYTRRQDPINSYHNDHEATTVWITPSHSSDFTK